MPSASLTRRISFSAAHRYSRPEWSDEKNATTFGACAWPNFHGHTYVCDVTVGGPIDDKTGFVIDLGVLDRILVSAPYPVPADWGVSSCPGRDGCARFSPA